MAPSDASNASLGVTALLDELLGQEEEPQLSAADQQQLAELHKEMDSCLESIENFRGEESRERRAKLMEELEAEFGFSCDVESESCARQADTEHGKDLNATLDEEDEDVSRYLGGANRRQHKYSEPQGPLMQEQLAVAATSSTKAVCRDETRRADAERIQKLRDEVEAMKQREAFGLGPYDVAEPDDLDATVGVATGLTAWCQEVDAVLDEPFVDRSMDPSMDPSANADAYGLSHARDGLHEMGTGLGAAQSRLNDDILEMEKLLAECGAQIQARKAALGN